MNSPFELFLFSADAQLIGEAVAAGVAGVVIDWEQAGKAVRQQHADTEINQQTVEDLRAARTACEKTILCRINPCGGTTDREIEDAVEAGADEILLPMVREAREVRAALAIARDRCKVGILVETVDAVQRLDALARLPVSRVYVGLNDLMIDRNDTCIFTPILDGTLERIRSMFRVPFGFAGLTLVRHGYPIPSRLLVGEMARLDCSFTFLRRSFHRDIRGHLVGREIPCILEAFAAAVRRSPDAVNRDRRELNLAIEQALRGWPARLPVSL
jgi:hypothetical protein